MQGRKDNESIVIKKNYEKLYNEKRNDIVWENSYYDYDRNKEVDFFDYSLGEKKYLYFLYYEIGEYSFHTPITEEGQKKILNWKSKKQMRIFKLMELIQQIYFQLNLFKK